jgi:hypothetical protein
MNEQDRIDILEKEFRECRENVGNKMLSMERDSIEKLVTLQVQTANIYAQLQTFVSQQQFAPVKLIAYGLAGGVLMTVLGAVLAKTLDL